MRRKDREVTDIGRIIKIMGRCKVMSLAMCADNIPYVVPLNFGYRYHEDLGISIYFHCAGEGKKLDILRENPKVCFEMDCGHALVSGDIACTYSFDFESVIGTGTVDFAKTNQEKAEGLDAIMEQQAEKTGFTYAEHHLAAVTVCKINVSEITGKIHRSKNAQA